mgnify:CR=1 FL=1
MVMRYTAPPTDFRIQLEGDNYLIQPLTAQAYDWIEKWIPKEAKWIGTSLSVNGNYMSGIMQLMNNEGLTVR